MNLTATINYHKSRSDDLLRAGKRVEARKELQKADKLSLAKKILSEARAEKRKQA